MHKSFPAPHGDPVENHHYHRQAARPLPTAAKSFIRLIQEKEVQIFHIHFNEIPATPVFIPATKEQPWTYSLPSTTPSAFSAGPAWTIALFISLSWHPTIRRSTRPESTTASSASTAWRSARPGPCPSWAAIRRTHCHCRKACPAPSR